MYNVYALNGISCGHIKGATHAVFVIQYSFRTNQVVLYGKHVMTIQNGAMAEQHVMTIQNGTTAEQHVMTIQNGAKAEQHVMTIYRMVPWQNST